MLYLYLWLDDQTKVIVDELGPLCTMSVSYFNLACFQTGKTSAKFVRKWNKRRKNRASLCSVKTMMIVRERIITVIVIITVITISVNHVCPVVVVVYSWLLTLCHCLTATCDVMCPVISDCVSVVSTMSLLSALSPVLSKVDDFATFKKVEVHAKNSTF